MFQMDGMALRKLDAFLPYDRWQLIIYMRHDIIKHAEICDSEQDAKNRCCAWYKSHSGYSATYDNIIKDLSDMGNWVVINRI
jgi:hypothetical protein